MQQSHTAPRRDNEWDEEDICEPLGTGYRWHGNCVIQKRVAYFDCTVALGDNCAALARVELPSFFLPASLVRPRLPHEMAGVAGSHRSSVDSTLRRTSRLRNR